jgi:hypothetical protein
VVPEEISVNRAVDRLVTAFDARGWRDDGDTAAAIARAAAQTDQVDASHLASVAKPRFLVSNRTDRATLEAVIDSALGGGRVVSIRAENRTETHISVSNTGTLIGPIGGGAVSGVQVYQQQVLGDDAISALVARYRDLPEVRQIVDADLAPSAKHSRLTAVVTGLGSFASDTLAKIVTGLITHP